MADSRRGPAPPPRPRPAAGPGRANRRLATVLGGGVLAVALGAVAWAGLHSSASTPTADVGSTTSSSSVIGPSVPKATPAATKTTSTKPTSAKTTVTKKTTAKPAAVATAAVKPVAKPVTKPVTKPVAKPVTKPVAKPVATPVGTSGGHVATRALSYRVVKGDTLWNLTQRSLASTGRSTSTSTVAAFVTRFYASNGTTVGPDPNLIVPGQVVTWPVGL